MATTITIRNVPTPVRDSLAARAAEAGQSLQEFMLAQATQLAARPTNAELVERMRSRVAASTTPVTGATIVDLVRAERDR